MKSTLLKRSCRVLLQGHADSSADSVVAQGREATMFFAHCAKCVLVLYRKLGRTAVLRRTLWGRGWVIVLFAIIEYQYNNTQHRDDDSVEVQSRAHRASTTSNAGNAVTCCV